MVAHIDCERRFRFNVERGVEQGVARLRGAVSLGCNPCITLLFDSLP